MIIRLVRPAFERGVRPPHCRWGLAPRPLSLLVCPPELVFFAQPVLIRRDSPAARKLLGFVSRVSRFAKNLLCSVGNFTILLSFPSLFIGDL